eukprot:1009089_1
MSQLCKAQLEIMPRQHTTVAVGKETLQIEKATSCNDTFLHLRFSNCTMSLRTSHVYMIITARSRCAPKLGGCGQKIELHSLRIKLSIRQDASRHYCNFKYFFHPK